MGEKKEIISNSYLSLYDGFHIRSLVTCLFYVLAPDIIKNGHFYILLTPLYIFKSGKETKYAYSDEERVEILKELEGKRFTEKRIKGLGGLSTENLADTAMSKDNYRMIQLTWNDAEECAKVMELCMSDDKNKAKERKEFIETYGKDYFDVKLLEV